MLPKATLASVLMLLSGCEHRDPSSESAARAPAAPTAEAAWVPTLTAAPGPSVVGPEPSIAAHERAIAPTANRAPKQAPRIFYVCPMHPDVILDAPGVCPRCAMNLEPRPATELHRVPPAGGATQASSGDAR